MPKYRYRIETEMELILPLEGHTPRILLDRYGTLVQVLVSAMCLNDHPLTIRLMRQESEGVWKDLGTECRVSSHSDEDISEGE